VLHNIIDKMREKRFAQRLPPIRGGVSAPAESSKTLFDLLARVFCYFTRIVTPTTCCDLLLGIVEASKLSRVSVTLNLQTAPQVGLRPGIRQVQACAAGTTCRICAFRPGVGAIGFERLCTGLLVGNFLHRVPSRCC
jgi:hypothetical protein